MTDDELKELIKSLNGPDVEVTNGRDKEIQTQKLARINATGSEEPNDLAIEEGMPSRTSEIDDARRKLRLKSSPAMDCSNDSTLFAASPSGAWLWCYQHDVLRLHDHSMQAIGGICHTFDVMDVHGICASEDRVYMAGKGEIYAMSREKVCDSGYSGMCTALSFRVAVWHAGFERGDGAGDGHGAELAIANPALSRDGRVLCAIQFEIPAEAPRGLNRGFNFRRGASVVVAFDADSLRLRCSFGADALRGGAAALAVMDDAVFVGEQSGDELGHGRVHAFSLDGAPLRQIGGGPWQVPRRLRAFRDRLFLLETLPALPLSSAERGAAVSALLLAVYKGEEPAWTRVVAALGGPRAACARLLPYVAAAEAGARVVVLTSAGVVCQVWGAPSEIREIEVMGEVLLCHCAAAEEEQERLREEQKRLREGGAAPQRADSEARGERWITLEGL